MEFDFFKFKFVDLQYTSPTGKNKIKINLELYNYQNTYEQKAKMLQILENTVNTHKYNTCTMPYFSCLEVCYLAFFGGIVFS